MLVFLFRFGLAIALEDTALDTEGTVLKLSATNAFTFFAMLCFEAGALPAIFFPSTFPVLVRVLVDFDFIVFLFFGKFLILKLGRISVLVLDSQRGNIGITAGGVSTTGAGRFKFFDGEW